MLQCRDKIPSELIIPSFWRMTMQDCQQKRCRDIPTTPSTNVEDDKFPHYGTKGRKKNVSLALSMKLQPSFCKYVIWPLALALLDQPFDKSMMPFVVVA